jgi:hypothetical protein
MLRLYQRKYTICLKQKIDSINSLIERNSEVEGEINVEDGFHHVQANIRGGVCKPRGVCFYTPRNEVVGGYTGFTMSVRPSVDKSYVVR